MAPKQTITDMVRPQTVPKRSILRNARRTYRKADKKNLAIVALLIILIGLFIFYTNRNNAQQKEIDRLTHQQSVSDDAQQLVNEVGKLVELPKDETPTVAAVSDASKLQTQPFFANAENGDKVLIYSQSKQAVLYRPSTHKVIQISNIDLGDTK